jgi:hypothetical protein
MTEGCMMRGRDIASAQTARRGHRHWHVRTLFAWEALGLTVLPIALLANEVIEQDWPLLVLALSGNVE